MNKLKKTYPSSKFYKGIIEGDYSVGKRNIVTPKKEAIVTMFTKKEFVIIPLQVEFSPKVSIGDTFNVSGIKTKIINKRKGKLKFKYY